ncbi:MAG TPA: pyridoxal phosphate-dependent aminotransferase [Candidatus Atribacteria bacterium]|nr:pyridoxal phosphate-dependent aminotransferase [Candidatus Atribacteria bacterium]
MQITERVKKIEPSATLSISARAKALKREGRDIISFSAGEPDFDTPLAIKEEAKKAIDEGFTKYTPTSGTPELKEAISKKLERENGLFYTPQEIIVSCGAKHSLFNAILTLCNPGDEVLLPKPYWVTYLEQIKLAEGKPVFLEPSPSIFTVSIEEIKKALTPRTHLLIINNPSNPTGVVWEEEELEEVAQLAKEKDLIIISDEIYEHLAYDGAKIRSIAAFPGMKDRTIVINGVSKTFSMTGWRIGYAAGPREVIEAMGRLQDHSTSNPTSISQRAAWKALQSDSSLFEKMVKKFDERRKLITQHLSEIPSVTFPIPRGAFYVFANFSPYLGKSFQGKPINNSLELAESLLEEAQIACVPGTAFGMEGYLRFSYAISEENIEKGMERLKNFVNQMN